MLPEVAAVDEKFPEIFDPHMTPEPSKEAASDAESIVLDLDDDLLDSFSSDDEQAHPQTPPPPPFSGDSNSSAATVEEPHDPNAAVGVAAPANAYFAHQTPAPFHSHSRTLSEHARISSPLVTQKVLMRSPPKSSCSPRDTRLSFSDDFDDNWDQNCDMDELNFASDNDYAPPLDTSMLASNNTNLLTSDEMTREADSSKYVHGSHKDEGRVPTSDSQQCVENDSLSDSGSFLNDNVDIITTRSMENDTEHGFSRNSLEQDSFINEESPQELALQGELPQEELPQAEFPHEEFPHKVSLKEQSSPQGENLFVEDQLHPMPGSHSRNTSCASIINPEVGQISHIVDGEQLATTEDVLEHVAPDSDATAMSERQNADTPENFDSHKGAPTLPALFTNAGDEAYNADNFEANDHQSWDPQTAQGGDSEFSEGIHPEITDSGKSTGGIFKSVFENEYTTRLSASSSASVQVENVVIPAPADVAGEPLPANSGSNRTSSTRSSLGGPLFDHNDKKDVDADVLDIDDLNVHVENMAISTSGDFIHQGIDQDSALPQEPLDYKTLSLDWDNDESAPTNQGVSSPVTNVEKSPKINENLPPAEPSTVKDALEDLSIWERNNEHLSKHEQETSTEHPSESMLIASADVGLSHQETEAIYNEANAVSNVQDNVGFGDAVHAADNIDNAEQNRNDPAFDSLHAPSSEAVADIPEPRPDRETSTQSLPLRFLSKDGSLLEASSTETINEIEATINSHFEADSSHKPVTPQVADEMFPSPPRRRAFELPTVAGLISEAVAVPAESPLAFQDRLLDELFEVPLDQQDHAVSAHMHSMQSDAADSKQETSRLGGAFSFFGSLLGLKNEPMPDSTNAESSKLPAAAPAEANHNTVSHESLRESFENIDLNTDAEKQHALVQSAYHANENDDWNADAQQAFEANSRYEFPPLNKRPSTNESAAPEPADETALDIPCGDMTSTNTSPPALAPSNTMDIVEELEKLAVNDAEMMAPTGAGGGAGADADGAEKATYLGAASKSLEDFMALLASTKPESSHAIPVVPASTVTNVQALEEQAEQQKATINKLRDENTQLKLERMDLLDRIRELEQGQSHGRGQSRASVVPPKLSISTAVAAPVYTYNAYAPAGLERVSDVAQGDFVEKLMAWKGWQMDMRGW